MKEEQNITIRIANISPFKLTIKPQDEEILRRAERDVNNLWRAWCDRFDGRTPSEVMAMVAFQFARYYHTAKADNEAVATQLEAFNNTLDTLLRDESSTPQSSAPSAL